MRDPGLAPGNRSESRADPSPVESTAHIHFFLSYTMRQDRAGVVFDFLKDAGKTAWTGGIETMGDLYQLSRLAVYLEKNVNISGVLSDGPVMPEKIDPRIMTIWSGKAKNRFPHLVFLKGINSYYLPVDFAAPLWLPFKNAENKFEEAFFGSSVPSGAGIARSATDA